MAGMRTTERDSKRLAARAENNRAFQLTARVGYAVSGLLHLMIGGIAIATAFGAHARADQTGALQAIVRGRWRAASPSTRRTTVEDG